MSASYLRACAGKQRHDSRDTALGHRRQLAQKRGVRLDRLTTYKCVQCGKWHVGNTGRGR